MSRCLLIIVAHYINATASSVALSFLAFFSSCNNKLAALTYLPALWHCGLRQRDKSEAEAFGGLGSYSATLLFTIFYGYSGQLVQSPPLTG